jgi:histidyl-tRNA synthetase
LTVETNLQEASLKQIFKEAKKNHARKIIILGDNEIKTKVVKIKDQKTGTEVTKTIAELSVQDLI